MAGLFFRVLFAICLILTPLFLTVYSSQSNDDEVSVRSKRSAEAPHGGTDFRDFLVVSTLDGRVTVLDPRKGGQVIWSLKTEPGELLSSSLNKLEIPTRGQWVRLVPSLDGQLYKFDGEAIEPIPVSADTLLKSSFKVSDNLIIVGGKETRSYGVNLYTGELKYVCSMEGCNKYGEISNAEDILVIERHTQTVRAVHTRTGTDQWNFSVGEHRVTVARGFQANFNSDVISEENIVSGEDILFPCNNGGCDEKSKSSSLKVVMPDGIVAAYNPSKHLLWSQKFSSPIENVWKLKEEEVWTLNLFDHETFLSSGDKNNFLLPPPLLVLGLYDKKLYIKHSPELRNQVSGATKNYLISSRQIMPRITWKPYIATAQSRTPFLDTSSDVAEEISTALILRGDFDYPFDRGFYLYDAAKVLLDNTTHCVANGSYNSEEEEEIMETIEQIIIVSLWHWWKEVIAISLASSVLINIFVYRCVFKKIHPSLTPESSGSEIHIVNPSIQPSSSEITEKKDEKEELHVKPVEYVSRYLTDFEPLQCLGKGGFGVVYEARNKIDDCCYAVKRIGLNNRDDAFEKVMREVKALAKLDHSGIVRYFNAWFETPPPGWQEMKDKEWDECSKTSASFGLSSLPSTEPHSMVTPKFRNPLRPFDTSENEESLAFINRSRVDGSSFGFDFNVHQLKSGNSAGSDSFEVVFDHSGAELCGDSPNSSGTLLVSKKTEFSRNTLSEKGDSVFLSSSDSRCADHSNSTEEEEIEKSISVDERQRHISEKSSARPSALSIPESDVHRTNTSTIYLYIQMQLCRKESLKDWLNFNIENRDRIEVLDIFDQIVNAVHYVHECGLMHRDLKPSNIFFSMDGTIKVGDFGLVTEVAEAHTPYDCDFESSLKFLVKHTDQVGTQLYMSPEQISRLPYNHKVDIFSLGLIFFELLMPFTTQLERIKVLLDVRKQKFPTDFTKRYVEECEFVSKLLSHKPAERPSAAEIKQHPLFKMFQPEPVVTSRVKRRRTLSQRLSSSGSDCDTNSPDGNKTTLNMNKNLLTIPY